MVGEGDEPDEHGPNNPNRASDTSPFFIQHRLHAARDGNWSTFTQGQWGDVAEHDVRPRANGHNAGVAMLRHGESDEPANDVPTQVLGRAAAKARAGAVRAAANLLIGLLPVRPSQELNIAVANLLRTIDALPTDQFAVVRQCWYTGHILIAKK